MTGKRNWRSKTSRSMSYFSYKYWWLVLLLFFIGLLLFFKFCNCLPYKATNNHASTRKGITHTIKSDSIQFCADCESNDVAAYDVPFTDTIGDRRGRLGGKTGVITISLAWNTVDDMDLLLLEPNNNVINFQKLVSQTGGILDVDRNAASVKSNSPLENIFYNNEPLHGTYKVFVSFYKRNESQHQDITYTVYVKFGNNERTLQYFHSNQGDIHKVFEFVYP